MKLSQWTVATNSGKKRPVVARWDTRDDLYLTTEHQISCLKNDAVYYSKRPTQASAFISKSLKPKAALSTPKGVFALSHGNTKLEYWSSSDAASETLTTLPSPAVDLEFCAASYIYGSCEDGKAFVVAGGTVEIVPSVIEGGTVLKTVLLQTSISLVGTKRKPKMESMKLYQIFQAKDGIVLVLHELNAEDTTIQVTRSDTKVLSKEYCDIKIVGVHQDQIGFCYTREKHRYFGSLSLTNAQISSLALPAGASAVALMGPFLVVLRGTLLLFLDSLRGGIIDEKSLPHTSGDYVEGSIEIVAKERKLAIIYGQDAVQVATMSLSSSTGSNLASLLSSSLSTSTSTFHVRQFVHSPGAALEESISTLINAYEHIVKSKALKDGFLIKAFENSLKSLSLAQNDGDNPQEQSPKKRSKTSLNGHHNGMNGNSALAPMEIPIAVVECATEVIVRLLCVDKLALSDSAILLRRLVRTKKILARKHFSSLPKILLALRRNLVYSASDLLTDMFAYCPDVSESQLVASLRFGIRFLTVDDVVVSATNGKKHQSNGHKDQKVIMKVIRQSLCLLLRQILSYSPCNDSLLRLALTDTLSTAEMGIVLNFLVYLLESSSDVNVKVQALQWLSTMCDCLNTKGDHSIDVNAIRRCITSYVKNIQGTIVLKGVLDSLLDSREGLKQSDSAWTGKLPPYQIERLTF